MNALSLILGTFDPIAGRRILDAGCGHGALAKALAKRGAAVTGIDPNPAAIGAATAALPSSRFETAAAEALPFAPAAFDGAVCLNALHHTGDPAKALAEMARVVSGGGRIVVIEPLAEGTFFDALRPIEDETEVRAKAQAAIATALASGAFTCERDARFDREERFASLEAFVERVVAVDPARKSAAAANRAAIEAAFASVEPDAAGERVLVQPLRAHVLVATARA